MIHDQCSAYVGLDSALMQDNLYFMCCYLLTSVFSLFLFFIFDVSVCLLDGINSNKNNNTNQLL